MSPATETLMAPAGAQSSVPDSPLLQRGRVAWSILGILGVVVAAAWLLPRVLLVVVPVVVALLFASILIPFVDRLVKSGLPRLAATWLVCLGGLALLAAAVFVIAPSVSSEAGALTSSLSGGTAKVEDWLVTGPLGLPQARVSSWAADLRTQFSSGTSGLARGVLAKTPLALHVLSGAILALVLTFFFSKDGPTVASRFSARLSPASLTRGQGAWNALTGYSQGLIINALVNATVLGIAMAVLGVPLALAIAAITFVASFIPIVGAIVSGIIAALVALVSAGPLTAAIIIAVTVIIHHLEGYVVGPLVIGRRVGLHPVVLILAFVVGTLVAGVPGAFLGGPLTAVAWGLTTAHKPEVSNQPLTLEE